MKPQNVNLSSKRRAACYCLQAGKIVIRCLAMLAESYKLTPFRVINSWFVVWLSQAQQMIERLN